MKIFAALHTLAFVNRSFHPATTVTATSCPRLYSSTMTLVPAANNANNVPVPFTESNAVKESSSSTIDKNFPQNVPLVSHVLPPLPDGSRRIYLLRHGETDWNKVGKIQGGGFDIPLNENGRRQALTTALSLEDIPIGVVASSHLSRAKETADILWHRHNGSVEDRRVILEGLGEMRFGEFEGLEWRDQEANPDLAARFRSMSLATKENIDSAFPGGGESTRDVQQRATQALTRVLEEYPDQQHIAVVAHGRLNKVLIAATALGDVMKFPTVKQGNTAINVIDIDHDGKWTVQTLNFLEHVKDNVIVR